jgi:DNA-binding MarR family transcriptional regulator
MLVEMPSRERNEPAADVEPRHPHTVPFMMHLISARNVAEATDEFLKLGFNVQNARVMIVALQNPGITPGRLGEMTCIESPALAYMLKRLESENLIGRRRSKTDGRSVSLHLTAKGKRLAQDCYAASVDHERRMLAKLSPSAAAAFRTSLKKMFDEIQIGNPTLEKDPEVLARRSTPSRP